LERLLRARRKAEDFGGSERHIKGIYPAHFGVEKMNQVATPASISW
jgi:hypothetical protein